MRTLSLGGLVAVVVLAACASAPSARSPLREALEKADTPEVESAIRKCLADQGWKVDDVGSVSGGSNVITAYKAKEQTDVYVHPSDQKPRITGGPDSSDPLWKCLAGELGGGGGADKDEKGTDGGAKPASSESSP